MNPSNSNAIAGTFKDETVYFTKAVEDLKTRHQWRMVMKDVIMQDVVPTTPLHGIDPTAVPRKDGEQTTQSNINDTSKSTITSQSVPGDENDADESNDCTIISDLDRSQSRPSREPIPPHKVVSRKRGDQEVKLDLYGAWQTEPYTVSEYLTQLCVWCHSGGLVTS